MADTLLSQRVYQELYEAMLSNRLRPGDRLNRRQVAEDLGVSVAPVLEAMTQLEWEGFLQTSPRLGTMVRPLTAKHALGRFLLRQAIEVEAARVYAGPLITARREDLMRLARKADAAKSGTLTSWRTEVDFHSALVATAGFPIISSEFAHVMRHSLYHAANRLLPGQPQREPYVHERLLDALCDATPDKADRLIRSHLAPWIAALTDAAESEVPEPATGYVRGSSVRLRPRRALSR
jgi:DNA-binding GntR family transcriptional regulator